jgi:hypothetical protein
MSTPAAFIVTRDRVFWSRWDDHYGQIVAENGIRLFKGSECQVVFCVVSPRDGDLSSPVESWVYRRNHSWEQPPDWYNELEVECRVREALLEWCKTKLFTEGVHEIGPGQVYVTGSAMVHQVLRGNVRGEQIVSGRVIAHQWIWDGATGTQKLYGQATGVQQSAGNRSTGIQEIAERATGIQWIRCGANGSQRVTQTATANQSVDNSSTGHIFVCDYGTATRWSSRSQVELQGVNATLVDRSVTPSVVTVSHLDKKPTVICAS